MKTVYYSEIYKRNFDTAEGCLAAEKKITDFPWGTVRKSESLEELRENFKPFGCVVGVFRKWNDWYVCIDCGSSLQDFDFAQKHFNMEGRFDYGNHRQIPLRNFPKMMRIIRDAERILQLQGDKNRANGARSKEITDERRRMMLEDAEVTRLKEEIKKISLQIVERGNKYMKAALEKVPTAKLDEAWEQTPDWAKAVVK